MSVLKQRPVGYIKSGARMKEGGLGQSLRHDVYKRLMPPPVNCWYVFSVVDGQVTRSEVHDALEKSKREGGTRIAC